jgi:amidase
MMAAVTVTVGGKVSQLLAGLAEGEVSASEVVSAHLAALHQVDAQTNAVAAFEDQRALADARGLDRTFVTAA